MKLTHAQIEKVRTSILVFQNYTCPLCTDKVRNGTTKRRPALDHDHKTGYIRGVLCLWCNGTEGRVENAARAAVGKDGDYIAWLENVVAYLKLHKTPQWSTSTRRGLTHPSHKTPEDRRLSRLAKAKKKRARAKVMKKVG